jgi:hypothetical protein
MVSNLLPPMLCWIVEDQKLNYLKSIYAKNVFKKYLTNEFVPISNSFLCAVYSFHHNHYNLAFENMFKCLRFSRIPALKNIYQEIICFTFVFQVSSMKWESSSLRPPSVGGMSTKSKMCSPGSSGIQGHPSDLIPDETLAQLSVKELNKRVQNLPRDDIVALKQRRRTLKNRG